MKNLLAIFVMVSVAVFGCSRSAKEPGYEVAVLSDMVHPVPIEAYREPMRMPVSGTVPRDSRIESPDGVQNPLVNTVENITRGQFVYETYCLVCHGKTGEGDGPIIPKMPNPPSFTSRRVMALTPQEIFTVITEGKRDMASYAAQISEEDRWKVVLYLEKMQGKTPRGDGM